MLAAVVVSGRRFLDVRPLSADMNKTIEIA